MSQGSHTQGNSDLFRLDERVALVSGGAGMYGSQLSRALAKAGALVVIASRHRSQCEELAQALRKENLRAEAAELDLSSEKSIRGLNAPHNQFAPKISPDLLQRMRPVMARSGAYRDATGCPVLGA